VRTWAADDGGMSFLVIEDDDELRGAIVAFLARRAHRVTACGSIAEANLALGELAANADAPDAVVSHIHLQDGDGVSFYIKASSRFPEMRWIVTSAGGEQLRVVG